MKFALPLLRFGALIASLLCTSAAGRADIPDEAATSQKSSINYRQQMRSFVEKISTSAKARRANFLVVPQGGLELLTQNGETDGPLATDYIHAINGFGQEDVFYGYDADDQATSPDDRDYLLAWLQLAKKSGLAPLVTDYCRTPSKVDKSYTKNAAQGWLSFAAPSNALEAIPTYPKTPRQVNAQNVTTLAAAKNFLYLINPGAFSSRAAYLTALRNTNYDVFIVDLYGPDDAPLSAAEVASLQRKANGGRRLVLCYMSIGEAENYRPYWKPGWKKGNPSFIGAQDPDWPGDYAAKYWDAGWQSIIVGGSNCYLDAILDAGFDGVYLDKVDEYEWWESHK